MIDDRFGEIVGALIRDLDDLHSFIDGSTRGISSSYPVILVQPPSNRRAAAADLGHTAAVLDSIAKACHPAAEKLARSLAAVERRKVECQQALVPVSGLPDEILCYIFDLALLPFDSLLTGDAKFTSPLRLSQVCSDWRRAARADRSLWGNLALGQRSSTEMIAQHIQFARGKPLQLAVVDEVPRVPLDLYAGDWLEKTESLVWESSFNPCWSFPQQAGTSVNLKALEIHKSPFCGLCYDEETLSGLLDLAFPRLRTLTLEDVDLGECQNLNAPTLNSLLLINVTVPPLSLNSVLMDLSMLEELHISRLHNSSGGSWEDATMDFTFPRLTTLVLTDLPSDAAIFFFQRVQYPELRRLEFTDITRDLEDDSGMLQVLRQFLDRAPHLSAVETSCSYLIMVGVLQGLDRRQPPDSAAEGGGLRSLSICLLEWLRPGTSDHEEDQQQIAAMAGVLLEHRRDAGLPPLEELSLHTCVDREDPVIVYLTSLVGALKMHKCGDFTCAKRRLTTGSV